MKLSTMSLALCFALTPFGANATDNAVRHHHALHHKHAAISATANALVPRVRTEDDSDGLSRNRNQCNRGCIDN